MNRCSVLIVDDRTHARQGLKGLLATAPAVQVVGEAAEGRGAIDLVEKCRPDVVLMDAMMPLMNGRRQLGASRQSGQRPGSSF